MLQTPTQAINAALVENAKRISSHLASISDLANRMTATLLEQSDENLTDWLNMRDLASTVTIFSTHGNIGNQINTASETLKGILKSSGIEVDIPIVDIRSMAEKLESKGRLLKFEDGVFSVAPIPAPEPPAINFPIVPPEEDEYIDEDV
jgi:hypothetical protein